MKLSEKTLHRLAQDGSGWPSAWLVLGGVAVLGLGAIQLARAEWRRLTSKTTIPPDMKAP